ncbi:MAG TPA: low molecular weight protein-tyrosine-phosphatase [Nevskiaceae bacterium]|nr:low molecular weight protein-tyrosine-phosphatase [Nevskiaceae bacterium]
MFNRILIVCTGNICRSPMAEGYMRSRLPAEKSVSSAGIAASPGEPAAPEAVAVMAAHGFDISSHGALQITDGQAHAADLILVADQTHQRWIARRFPQLRGRVHKLLKWEGNRDIEDPYGLPQSYFEQTYAEIEMGVSDWLKRL